MIHHHHSPKLLDHSVTQFLRTHTSRSATASRLKFEQELILKLFSHGEPWNKKERLWLEASSSSISFVISVMSATNHAEAPRLLLQNHLLWSGYIHRSPSFETLKMTDSSSQSFAILELIVIVRLWWAGQLQWTKDRYNKVISYMSHTFCLLP